MEHGDGEGPAGRRKRAGGVAPARPRHHGAPLEGWWEAAPLRGGHPAAARERRRWHGRIRTALILAISVLASALVVWLLTAEILMTFG